MISSTSKRVLKYVLSKGRRNDPESGLEIIDECGYKKFFLMNIGDKKGQILEEYIISSKAKNILELGVYLGYSTIRIARSINDEAHIHSIEANKDFLEIAKQHLDFAGLSDKVSFFQGKASEIIPQLNTQYDFIFIDHWKEAYLHDLKLLIQHDCLNDGAIVFADNIVLFHLEDYLNFVRTSPRFTSKFIPTLREYSSSHPDGVEISYFNK